jgi:uncharacterized protein (DUF2236 family)
VTSRSPRDLADVLAEGSIVAGGGRAILLQIANPAVGHGVSDHSDFAHSPVSRLRHTLAYVYALVYGTPAQAALVRDHVNRAHARVRSSADAPLPYDATDARLQLWVAATLYDNTVDLYGRLFAPLDETAKDTIYREYEVLGSTLQVPPGLWPADRAAFADYWRREVDGLRVDDTARAVARDLLHPSSAAPLWLRLAMPFGRLVTIGLLPAAVREQYGFAWDAPRARRFERALVVLRVANRVLPRRVRELPKTWLLARLDRPAARAAAG